MNRIKDFIYNKNDLLVAIIIVTVATLVIATKVDLIMAYPSTLVSEAKPPLNLDEAPISDEISMGGSIDEPEESNSDPTNNEQNAQDSDPRDDDNSKTETTDQNGSTSTDDDVVSGAEGGVEGLVSIYIEYGATGNDIANLLIDSGLIKTKEEFYDAVREAGADTKLQAGNFKIPSNASPVEIVRIITN